MTNSETCPVCRKSGATLQPVEVAGVIADVCETCAMWLGYGASINDPELTEPIAPEEAERRKQFGAEMERRPLHEAIGPGRATPRYAGAHHAPAGRLEIGRWAAGALRT
jgi:hypothetical protein